MGKLQCPICGAFTSFSPVVIASDLAKRDDGSKYATLEHAVYTATTEDKSALASYSILTCQSCDNRFIAEKRDGKWISVFPIPFEPISTNIPEPIRSEFNEAKLCLAIGAYRAAVTMCETALEAMWRQQKVSTLKELRDKGIISDKLFRKADQVRRWANVAKHELIHDPVTKDEAEQLISYLEKVIDDVYIEELEIASLSQKLKEKDISYHKIQLKDIRDNWKQAIDSLKGEGAKGNLDAVLRSACEPILLDGGVLTLGFYHEFHKEYTEQYKQLIERKFSDLFSTPINLEFKIIDIKAKAGN